MTDEPPERCDPADVSAIVDRTLAAPPRCGGVRVVAIDGGAGAGKTTLADVVAMDFAAVGVDVVMLHTDRMLDGWDGQFTFWDRLRRGVLDPLAAGRPGRYDRFDWRASRFGGEVEVEPCEVLVVEGVSAVAACGERAALTVWVDVDRPARERRWSARDGEPVQPLWVRWLDAEDAFFAANPVRADVVVTPTAEPAVRTLGGRVVYENPWLRVREDRIAYAHGGEGRYGVIEKDDFVLVIAAEHGGFWLVEQYRYPLRSRQWEFCQGGWGHGASGTPEELAATELAEEVGLHAGKLTRLGRLFAAYGYSDQAYEVFLATDLTAGTPRRESTEQDMVHRWFADAEVRAMVADGRLADGHSVAALTLLDAHRARGATSG